MKKLRFIHITKTGGQSVVATVDPFIPKERLIRHGENKGLTEILKNLNHVPFMEDDLDRTTFAIVRNPYSRVESLYNFYKYKRKDVVTENTFRDFVMNIDFYYKGEGVNHPPFTFKSCFDYCNWNGEILVNHILKFENLKEDWEKFAKMYKLNTELQHRNANDKKEQNLIWDTDMINKVREVYHNDFEAFGYDKTYAKKFGEAEKFSYI